MKTKIYIVRHSKTTGNLEKRLTGRTEFDITEEGKEYIELLTKRLKDIKFDKVYSSSSSRAIKTIEPLAKLNDCVIETSEDLCEMYFGIYDGSTWDKVNEINPEIDRNHIKTNEIMGIPEQENTEEVADRMYKKIKNLCMENKGKTILVGSHGVAIEAFLRKITAEPFNIKREEYGQKNTSLNIVEYDDELEEFKIILLNDFSHLNK